MELPDLHIHSTHSDGDLSVGEVARLARRRKITAAITDHLSPYHMLYDADAFDRYAADVRGSGLLLGAEYCIGEPIPVGAERLARLDFLMGGIHATRDGSGEKIFFWSEKDVSGMDAFMENYFGLLEDAFVNDPIDIIAHPTFLPLTSMDDYDEVWTEDRSLRLAELAIEHNVALELSGRWRVPGPAVVEVCLKAGAMFSSGSDAHHRENLFDLAYAYEIIELTGIKKDRLFLPAEKKTCAKNRR